MKNIKLKPFLKWAGGKNQLLNNIREAYPKELGNNINKYAEPFVGGGAVLFDILSSYNLKSIYISDINYELINTYRSIVKNPNELIEKLLFLQKRYVALDENKRKIFYYKKRDKFNNNKYKCKKRADIDMASLFIFLNKTCFNGLYRVNKRGYCNVPVGDRKSVA